MEGVEIEMSDIQIRIEKLEEDYRNRIISENDKKHILEERVEGKNNNLRKIYNSYISSVDSGNKLFLQNIISGRISAFIQGFYLYLTSQYSTLVATEKIKILEFAHNEWKSQNFE